MFNAQDNIGNCLDSLLHQDLAHNEYEILIMDDGSRDNSVAIVEDYAKKFPIVKLIGAKNSGCYSTRNKLLKLAQGDYIYNLDADDYIVHNCLGRLLDVALDENADILGFKSHETKQLDEKTLVTEISKDQFKISSGRTFIENHLKLRFEIWWYFIKRKFLAQHELAFNNNEYNADVVFTVKAILNAKKFVFLPVKIHRYVQTQDSLMRSKSFEIIVKRLSYSQMMIVNLSEIIGQLKAENTLKNSRIIHNLSHRRDVFVFFHIVNMIRNSFSNDYIKTSVEALKHVQAYPIDNFIYKEYHTHKYRMLLHIINRPALLYSASSFKNIFSKSQNQRELNLK